MINNGGFDSGLQKRLLQSQGALNQSIQRLSTGKRLNSAADDATGLQFATKIFAELTGLAKAAQNANQGVSLAQTADTALSETQDNLLRLRELAVQSANGTLSDGDRQAMQAEAGQLLDQVGSVASSSQFNGQNLLDGTFQNKALQVGAQAGDAISLSLGDFNADNLGQVANAESNLESTITSTNSGAFQSGGTGVDGKIGEASANGKALSVNGSALAAGELVINGRAVAATEGGSAKQKAQAINRSNIDGVTAKATAAVFTSNNTQGISVSGSSQKDAVSLSINGQRILSASVGGKPDFTVEELVEAVNARSVQTGVVASRTEAGQLRLEDADGDTFKVELTYNDANGGSDVVANTAFGNSDSKATVAASFEVRGAVALTGADDIAISGTGAAKIGFNEGVAIANEDPLSDIDLGSQSTAQDAIATIDQALNQVSSARAQLGALENRFISSIQNNDASQVALTSSMSRIEDADFAQEIAEFTKNQMKQQLGIALRAQANVQAESVLKLLKP